MGMCFCTDLVLLLGGRLFVVQIASWHTTAYASGVRACLFSSSFSDFQCLKSQYLSDMRVLCIRKKICRKEKNNNKEIYLTSANLSSSLLPNRNLDCLQQIAQVGCLTCGLTTHQIIRSL